MEEHPILTRPYIIGEILKMLDIKDVTMAVRAHSCFHNSEHICHIIELKLTSARDRAIELLSFYLESKLEYQKRNAQEAHDKYREQGEDYGRIHETYNYNNWWREKGKLLFIQNICPKLLTTMEKASIATLPRVFTLYFANLYKRGKFTEQMEREGYNLIHEELKEQLKQLL